MAPTQVVNAARTLAAHPGSHVAQKNMAVFREAWLENVSLLADCIDVIVSLQDFLAVTGTDLPVNNYVPYSRVLCRFGMSDLTWASCVFAHNAL